MKVAVRRLVVTGGIAALWIAAIEVLGILSSFLSMHNIPQWYGTLLKPSWSPPSWLFGPVWTLLYALMAIAVYLIYARKGMHGRNHALLVFAIQLFLNLIWTPIFFGLQSPLLALAVIAGLWCMIVITIVRFARIEKTAAWLMVPYLAWVSFAAVLNGAIVFLNYI